MLTINNGIGTSTIYKGLDDELSLTSVDNTFAEMQPTNGMHFTPLVDKSNDLLKNLTVFDPANLMFSQYSGAKATIKLSDGIKLFKYDISEPLSSRNVSLAYG